MNRKYANSPIIEAICELRLSPKTKWDLTIPGLIYEKIKTKLPIKEERFIKEVKFEDIPQAKQQQIRTNTNNLILFRSKDGKDIIQVGTLFMSVNRLRPYKSWSEFRPRIEEAFKILSDTTDFKELQRIGLRYINRIELPELSKIEDYFEFRPSFGKGWPETISNFIIGCFLNLHDDRDICKIQLVRALEKGNRNPAFILDIDYYLADPKAVSKDKVLEWIDTAHGEVEKIFEGCIKERLRDLFS